MNIAPTCEPKECWQAQWKLAREERGANQCSHSLFLLSRLTMNRDSLSMSPNSQQNDSSRLRIWLGTHDQMQNPFCLCASMLYNMLLFTKITCHLSSDKMCTCAHRRCAFKSEPICITAALHKSCKALLSESSHVVSTIKRNPIFVAAIFLSREASHCTTQLGRERLVLKRSCWQEFLNVAPTCLSTMLPH